MYGNLPVSLHFKGDEEETPIAPEDVTINVMGKVELTEEEGEMTVQSRGEKTAYYLAWEHEDLSHPSFRCRDEPEQKDYDWMQLGLNVAGSLLLVGSLTVLAATGVGLAVEAGLIPAGAAAAAKATFLTGALYVGEQAVSDIISGRVSDTEKYVRKALAGSAVGFLSGATGLMMQGAALGKTLALGYSEGFLGSVITQGLLNEDGEINWAVAIGEGMFSAVMAGVAWDNANAGIKADSMTDITEEIENATKDNGGIRNINGQRTSITVTY